MQRTTPPTRIDRRPRAARRPRGLAVAAALCALLAAAAAETRMEDRDFTTLSLEDLGTIRVPTVVGASKHEQKTTEAPASVSIVTRDDIQKFGYRTLTDILRSLRGVYASSDQIYSYIGVRGINRPGDYGGRTLLTVNGHRLNDPVYDSTYNGQELPLDVDLIERVEVIRGPGSALYGNNALLGVINIVTRDGRGLGGVEAAASGASYDTYTGRLSFGRQFTNGLNLLLSGSFLDSVGQNDLYYPEYASIQGGRSRGLDEEQAHSFFASATWHDLTLEGAYGKRNREVPNAAYGTRFGVSPNEITDERAYVELRWERLLPKDWTLNARVFADHYLYEGTQPYDTDPPGGTVLNSDQGKAQYVGGELRVSKTLFQRHRVTAGTEWRYTTALRQDNHNVDPYEVFSDVDSDFHNVGVFVQDEYTIARPLSLHAGLRYDWFSTVGDTLNPRAALLVTPWEDTTLKLLYGEAFRAPNAYEFDYVAPGYAANQALQPESIRSYEVVLEQGFARHYRASASLFLNRMDDLITQQEEPDPANPGQSRFIFRNTDEVEARGAELEVEADYGGGWRLRASYSYVEATDQATDEQLANSHTHLGRVNLIAPLYPGKLFAGLEVQAGSARQTLQGNQVGGFARCNLTLYSRQLLPGLEASASLYNLFDTRAADPVGADLSPIDSLPQEGRSFRVKLTYSF